MSNHNPFYAAINYLAVMADKDFANGAPHLGSCRAAIRVLEAAGKINKKELSEVMDAQEVIEGFAWVNKDREYQDLCDLIASLPDEKEEGKK